MENLIKKLVEIPNNKINCNNWALEEQKQLLELYLIISKNEKEIFKLIYSFHDCDSWEDIFRDYNKEYLKDKATGVKVAIENISKKLNKNQ